MPHPPNGGSPALRGTPVVSAADVRQRGIRETNTAVAAKQKTTGIPSFEDNPLGAIGFVLQSVSAGLSGKEQPIVGLRRAGRAQQQLDIQAEGVRLRQEGTRLDALDFYMKRAVGLNPDEREALIKTIEQTVTVGGIGESLRELSKLGEEKAKQTVDFLKKNHRLFSAFSVLVQNGMPVAEALKQIVNIQTAAVKHEVLAPLRIAEAGATAQTVAAGTAAGTPDETETQVVKTRDKNGDQVTILIDKNTGETIREIGRGPTVIFQPPKEPGTKAKNLIETGLVEGIEAMARLQNTQANFKPEFLQLVPRLKVKGLKAAEKLGFNISKANKATITAYSAWTRDAIENLNLGIKFLTGAQMSEPEADRLRKGFPDPENDGPTEFLAKLNSSIDRRAATMLRFDVLRKQGLDGPVTESIANSMPLTRFLPPADEPDAVLMGADNDGNPIFRRPGGTMFKVTP